MVTISVKAKMLSQNGNSLLTEPPFQELCERPNEFVRVALDREARRIDCAAPPELLGGLLLELTSDPEPSISAIATAKDSKVAQALLSAFDMQTAELKTPVSAFQARFQSSATTSALIKQFHKPNHVHTAGGLLAYNVYGAVAMTWVHSETISREFWRQAKKVDEEHLAWNIPRQPIRWQELLDNALELGYQNEDKRQKVLTNLAQRGLLAEFVELLPTELERRQLLELPVSTSVPETATVIPFERPVAA